MSFHRLSALALLATLAAAAPSELHRRASLPPVIQSAVTLGNSTSNFPRIYRDGGGGGQINGKNYAIFSDGIYTTSGIPKNDLSNWANFTSNSIALIANPSNPRALTDYGNSVKGPIQPIPYFYNSGESDSNTGIWPNNNIVTLCSGSCGVTFPIVISRVGGVVTDLYNTGVKITIAADGTPIATRPTKSLFLANEPNYGSFSAVTGIDGYLYMFAPIKENSPANGLKLARVPQTLWHDRAQYQYWNGNAWTMTMPAKDHVASTVLKWSKDCFGTQYGPIWGDVFWSNYYLAWIMVFQSAGAVCDRNGERFLKFGCRLGM